MSRIRKFGKCRASPGKKAFITDVIVDFWAYITFVLVVIVFAILYKYAAEAKLQAVEDVKDVAYGNYLAQVYLRTPLNVGTEKMTVAELIALYDYNQTLERRGSPPEDIEDSVFYDEVAHFFDDSIGDDNPMRSALHSITRDFVDKNFDNDRCFLFTIKGSGFEYQESSAQCISLDVFFLGPIGAARITDLMDHLPSLPNASIQTYVASVDPRAKPIIIYSIYDMERLVQIYGED
jgi:hypothetical protein